MPKVRLQIVDPVLTTVAQGFKNAMMIGEAILPRIPVPEKRFQIVRFGKEDFLIRKDDWALRAQIRRYDYDPDADIFETADHALETGRDIREYERADSAFMLERGAVNKLRRSQTLIREKLISDLVIDPATYDASNRTTLSGTDQWSDYGDGNSNPIADIEVAKEEIRSDVGQYPNLLTLGAKTYAVLKHHPLLLERIAPSQLGVVTTDLMQTIFDIPKVQVGKAVYSTDEETFTDVWPDIAHLAFVADTPAEQRDKEEPSFGYTFELRNWPRTRSYDTDNPITRNFQVLDSYRSFVLGPDAGYLIIDTAA